LKAYCQKNKKPSKAAEQMQSQQIKKHSSVP
jgi:hypothetical protein